MNTKFCLLLLLVVCIAGFVTAKPENGSGSCGENEEFTSCGSSCPPTCATINNPIVCPSVCVDNICQCIPGYLRDDEGRCIPREDC